jgi:hypothetical protein
MSLPINTNPYGKKVIPTKKIKSLLTPFLNNNPSAKKQDIKQSIKFIFSLFIDNLKAFLKHFFYAFV